MALLKNYSIRSTEFSAGWIQRSDGRAAPLTLGGARDLLDALLDKHPSMVDAPFVSATGDVELMVQVRGTVLTEAPE